MKFFYCLSPNATFSPTVCILFGFKYYVILMATTKMPTTDLTTNASSNKDMPSTPPVEGNDMATNMPMEEAESPKKGAKESPTKQVHIVKPLLLELASITDKDHDKVIIMLEVDNNIKSETYGKDYKVATTIGLTNEDGNKTFFDLNKLDIFQL